MKILSNKMALAFWLLLLRKYTHLISSKSSALTVKKQKPPYCYENLRGILSRYEHSIKVRLHYSILTYHL